MSINHTDKTEITAPIAHHLEQQLPALVTDNNGHWQKFTILNAADLLDGTALKYKLSIEDVFSSKKHKGPVEITESTDQVILLQQSPQNIIALHPKAIPNTERITSKVPQFISTHRGNGTLFRDSHISISVESTPFQPIQHHTISLVFPKFGGQANGKGLLKGNNIDIILECSLPHQFSDELTLHIMQGSSSETLDFTMISPTQWKADGAINFYDTTSGIMVFIQSRDGSNEACVVITTIAMIHVKEDSPTKHTFVFVGNNHPVRIKMAATVASDLTAKFGTMPKAINYAATEAFLQEVANINPFKTQYKETEIFDNITHAIFHCKNAISLYPCNRDAFYYRIINGLGTLYLMYHEYTGNLQDIDHAISCFQSIVESTPSGHTDLPEGLSSLGTSYRIRFEHTKNLQDIDYSIFHHQNAIKSTPSGHTNFPEWLSSLGTSYRIRFEYTKNLEDIDHSILHHQNAVKSTPSGHNALLARLNRLEVSYCYRFKYTGSLQDIDHVISHYQIVLESISPGHTDLPRLLINFGAFYSRRFEHTKNLQDIKHAISYIKSAVESTPSGHTNLPSMLNDLGTLYTSQFKHTANVQDINHAILHLQNAVKSTPSGHTDLLARLSNLGISYYHRFEHTGHLQDIDHAISYYQNIVGSTPFDHTDFPEQLSNLGNYYSCRFKYTGNLQDIDHAIHHLQHAVKSTPSGHNDLSCRLSNLGSAYLRRFTWTGNLQEIDHAIFHHQNAVQTTFLGDTALQFKLINLGTAYLARFNRIGNPQDIDHAVFYNQNAVECTSSSHTEFSAMLINLALCYLSCYEHTKNIQDIELAISHLQNAIESSPSSHANHIIMLNNLGICYSSRFRHTKNLQDIKYAIFHLQNAIESTPSGHAILPHIFHNLGNSYLTHFKHTQNLQDMAYAISHFQSAIKYISSGNVKHSHYLKALGKSYKYRFESSHYFPDIEYSINLYRQAAVANGIPSTCLKSAKNAARLSLVHNEFHCLIDFSVAINLLSEVAGLEQTIHQRHANLYGHSDFIGLSIATALNLDRTDLALEWLENSRCLVWNQLNQLRAPIEDLCSKHSSLANKFIQVASALEHDGTRSALSIAPSRATLLEDISLQNNARNHTLHAAEYKQLLEKIRELPDFGNFLKPPKSTNLLKKLPEDGPIVIFNLHSTQCDALALIAGAEESLHIPLKNFSLADAEKLQEILQVDILKQRKVEESERLSSHRNTSKTLQMSFVLQELWSKVVQPILEALAYSVPPTPSNRSRIWWCPTGPLSFLPLHAAGIYGTECPPGSCISDFVVSSYTPTVRSINNKFAASSTLSKHTKLLLISQPNTPGLPSIISTRKETHMLEAMMSKASDINTLLLEDDDATINKVMSEMESHNWVHFACHGIQDQNNPLESGVHLHNGRLELLKIMQQKLQNPKLAFLSACQTSKGDNKLSEEAVHLTAGMLSAGYCGVIGTMWSISDSDGPKFAKEFYEYLFNESDGLDSTHAAYALDYAINNIRKTLGQDNTAFLTWVPYVHFGY